MNVLIDRLLKYSGFRWDPSSFAPMVGLIQSRPAIEQLQMADAARAMKLYDFEKTVYWGIISGAIVSRDKRCRNCAYPARLTVHHVTYVNLGREWEHLDDLETLCWSCHTVRHPHLLKEAARGAMRKVPNMTLDEAMRAESKKVQDRRLNAANHRHLRSPYDGPGEF